MKDSTADAPFIKPTTAAEPITMSDIFNTPAPTEPMVFVEDIYYPTRLDYFAARALQGFITGRSENDFKKAAKRSVTLAKELVALLDKAL